MVLDLIAVITSVSLNSNIERLGPKTCQETALSPLDRQKLCLDIHSLTDAKLLVFSVEQPTLHP